MNFLSVAMMVKNEEKHLERALKSLLPLIPHVQIIILDTGSTDRTVEIAKKYTKHVYHQSWQNDFSIHRNKSFSYATGDWIMQLDADEELLFYDDVKDPLLLIQFLEKIDKNINAVAIRLRDWHESKGKYAAEFDTVRIFRNGKVTYRRKIHNEPIYEGEAGYFGGGYLKHYGYDLSESQKIKKAERTVNLLLKSIEEDPEDYESYFYLAQAYEAWNQDSKSSMKYAKIYIEHKDKLTKKFNPSIYHLVIAIHLKNKEYEDAAKIINEATRYDPDDIDVCWDMLQLGIKSENKQLIMVGAAKFVSALAKFDENRFKNAGRFFFNNNENSYATALFYLVLGYMEAGTIEYRKLMDIREKCTDKIKLNIDTHMKNLLNELGWQKKDEKRIITPATPVGGNKIILPAGATR